MKGDINETRKIERKGRRDTYMKNSERERNQESKEGERKIGRNKERKVSKGQTDEETRC